MARNLSNLKELIPFRWFSSSIYFILAITYIVTFIFIMLANLPPDLKDFVLEGISKKTIIADENIYYIDRSELENNIKEFEENLPYFYRFQENHKEKFISNFMQFLEIAQIENEEKLLENLKKRYAFSSNIVSFITTSGNTLSRYSNRLLYLYEIYTERFIVVDRVIENKATNFALITRGGTLFLPFQQRIIYPIDALLLGKLVEKIYPDMRKIEKEFLLELLENLILPTAILDDRIREEKIKEFIDKNVKKFNYIIKGEKIILRGEKIDSTKFEKISTYIEEINKKFLKKILTYFFLSLSIYLTLIYRIYHFEKNGLKKKRNIILGVLFFIIANLMFCLASILYRELYTVSPFLLIPFGIISSLLPIVLIEKRMAVTLLVSFSPFILFYPFFETMAFLNILSLSLISIYTSKILKRRSDFFYVGLILGAIEIFFTTIDHTLVTQNLSISELTMNYMVAIGNGLICSVLSLGILPFIEDVFNIPTHFKLLELSNASTSKLLKELRTEAKGTYNHSIIIGDMCESAAEAIGLDPLLVKVGAYYHDIGKMKNPEYFVENQDEVNKHQDIKISMSVSIIKSHVKLGVEIARKYRIPEEIIDFIREHHGTMPVSYFYHQAIGLYGDDKVDISDYRYPGPKPSLKETALLMLADSVEATIRAYYQNTKKITPSLINDIIEDTFNKKIEQGQLEDCNITLKELATIKKEFFKFLSSYYHKRIDYRV